MGAIGALSDGQLLERFATARGEPRELAFAALVERHGPFVLRVCRSVLRDENAAEDAFQATFLALAARPGRSGHKIHWPPGCTRRPIGLRFTTDRRQSGAARTNTRRPPSGPDRWRRRTMVIMTTSQRSSMKKLTDCRVASGLLWCSVILKDAPRSKPHASDRGWNG